MARGGNSGSVGGDRTQEARDDPSVSRSSRSVAGEGESRVSRHRVFSGRRKPGATRLVHLELYWWNQIVGKGSGCREREEHSRLWNSRGALRAGNRLVRTASVSAVPVTGCELSGVGSPDRLHQRFPQSSAPRAEEGMALPGL